MVPIWLSSSPCAPQRPFSQPRCTWNHNKSAATIPIETADDQNSQRPHGNQSRSSDHEGLVAAILSSGPRSIAEQMTSFTTPYSIRCPPKWVWMDASRMQNRTSTPKKMRPQLSSIQKTSSEPRREGVFNFLYRIIKVTLQLISTFDKHKHNEGCPSCDHEYNPRDNTSDKKIPSLAIQKNERLYEKT